MELLFAIVFVWSPLFLFGVWLYAMLRGGL